MFNLFKYFNCRKKPVEVEAQGIMDIYQLFDKEFVDKIKAVINTIDVRDDGWIHVKLDLKVKKND